MSNEFSPVDKVGLPHLVAAESGQEVDCCAAAQLEDLLWGLPVCPRMGDISFLPAA